VLPQALVQIHKGINFLRLSDDTRGVLLKFYLGRIVSYGLERGLSENGSVSGAKSQEGCACSAEAAAKDTCVFWNQGQLVISFRTWRPCLLSRFCDAKIDHFHQILWTRRILPLNALNMLVIHGVSLALFACSATKFVSRHDQTRTDDTP
jgi:hypothetical protein